MDKTAQEEMRKYYNNSSYYKDCEHNFVDNKTKFNQYMIRNVLKIYYPLKGDRIIDIGCGWGNISLKLQKEGFNVIGIDYSKTSIDICKRSARKQGLDENRFFCRDAANTLLSSNAFDVVYCSDLVEHLYPDVYISFVKEVYRILKKGGKFIIYTPNSSHILEILKNNNVILKKDITHVDYKTMARLKQSLSNEGFTINKSYYIESHIPFMNIIEKMLMTFIPFFRRRNIVLGIKNDKRLR